ncbi:hypothetical protein VC273_20910 [Xanthomonas nasturtii]|uniref:hypothetical protein n=1 Tax=Xanthomonas TaxID=338 RepID=UPI002B22BDB4|nr:hypothetical protein [Xanthomonas nasturtii]MEA9558262.1 hypothetical protein [Xanthomonas nasturtii]
MRYRSQGLAAALFAQTVRVSSPNDGKAKRTGLIASADDKARLPRALLSQGLPAALLAQTARMSLPDGGKPKRTGVIASTPAHRATSQL